MATDNTLFDRLGGSPAIAQVTAAFYAAVLDDPLLAPLFADVDMAKLAGMQAAFLSMAFSGPDGYTGRDLRAAHQGLRLGDEHFDRVVTLLTGALKGVGAGDREIGEVAAVAESVRGDVLGRI